MLPVILLSLGFSAPAWGADVTVTVTLNLTPPPAHVHTFAGEPSTGDTIHVHNETGDFINVTVIDGDGLTVLLDDVRVADLHSVSAQVLIPGVGTLCTRPADGLEDTDELCTEFTIEETIIPTVSEWALIIMTLLAFGVATILYGRRRVARVAA